VAEELDDDELEGLDDDSLDDELEDELDVGDFDEAAGFSVDPEDESPSFRLLGPE
jgi:hypothetical protein